MNPNDAAFAAVGDRLELRGLTKRELIAAMMMQGILSDSNNIQATILAVGPEVIHIATSAVDYADKLIAELDRTAK